MLTLIKNTWKLIKVNIKELFIFLICYHAAAILIMYNFYSASIDFALKRAGYSNITAENIITLIKNPTSVFLILINCAMFIIFMGFEIICLLENYRAASYKVKLQAYKIFLIGLFKIGRIVKTGNMLNVVAGLLVLPFICLYFIIQEMSNVKVFHYLMEYIYNHVKYDELLYLFFLIIVVISFLSSFVIPYVVFGGKSAKEAIQSSFITIKKKARNTWRYLIEWNLMLAAFTILLHGIAMVAATLFISIFFDSDVALANLLMVNDWITLIIGLLSNVIGIAGNMAFIYSIFSLYRFSKFNEEADEFNIYLAVTNKALKRATLIISCIIVGLEIIYSVKLIQRSTEIAQEMFVTTQITAHRGGAAYAPENTLAALAAAVEMKSDYAEIDVQETKDGTVILLHDSNFKRTTGFNAYVWNMNYSDVKKLDAGSKFGRDFAGERIPTLDEVLKFCKGKIDLNIEIKNNEHNEHIAKRVVEIIESNNAVNHCVVTSMDYSLLSDVKALNSDIRTGYILKVAYGDFVNRVDADFLSIKHTYATKKVITAAHNCGKEVHVWTVNSRTDIERMKLLDVDNIITDRPVTVREVYASEKSGKSFIGLLKVIFR